MLEYADVVIGKTYHHLYYSRLRQSVSAPKNPTGKKYKIINFNPVYEKVKIYREPDYKGS